MELSDYKILDKNRFDVNSEAYFNEKLYEWLCRLTRADLRTVLRGCFSIPTDGMTGSHSIHPWDAYDSTLTEFGRFDIKLDFGKSLCVILELKVGTEATVGQLNKYLDYIPTAGYRSGYVVLLSRNPDAVSKLGYDALIEEYPNLLFVTWQSFEQGLKRLLQEKQLETPKVATENLIELISFLTDLRKRSERLIDQPSPLPMDFNRFLSHLVPAPRPKKKDVVLGWQSRLQFWNEVLDTICTQIGHDSFCVFRFDLYEWMMRWAFHCKKVVFDIYEDKNYEYLYNHFFSTIYPNSKGLPKVQYADLYYRILLIRDDKEFLETNRHRIFFRTSGKKVYFYAVAKPFAGGEVPYIQLFNYHFSEDQKQNLA